MDRISNLAATCMVGLVIMGVVAGSVYVVMNFKVELAATAILILPALVVGKIALAIENFLNEDVRLRREDAERERDQKRDRHDLYRVS